MKSQRRSTTREMLIGDLRVTSVASKDGKFALFASVLLLLASTTLPVRAQTAGDGSATADGSTAQRVVPSHLMEVPDVRADMTSEQLLELAGKKLEDKRYEDAERLLKYLVTENPNNLTAVFSLARVYEIFAHREGADVDTAGSQDRAEQFKRLAVEQYYAAAELSRKMGEYQYSEQLYNGGVLRYEPAHARAKLGLARVYAATNRELQAIENYRDYLKSPEGKVDSRATLELGRIYREKGFFGQAVSMLQEAEKMDPNDPDIFLELAQAHGQMGRNPKAVEIAKQALDKAAGFREDEHRFRNAYATFLLQNQQLVEGEREALEAIRLIREKLDKNPADVRLLQALASYLDTHQRALAMLIQQADDTPMRLRLADVLLDKGEVNRMLSYHMALATLPPAQGEDLNNIQLLETMAELLLAVQRKPEAAATCEHLLKLDPNNQKAKAVLERIAAEEQGELEVQAKAQP